MTTYSTAIARDIAGEIEGAINDYEDIVTNQPIPPLDAYVNLALIYWQITDYGFSTYYGLSDTLLDRAALRYRELLKVAQDLYPTNPEPRFWDLYLDFILTGSNRIQREHNALSVRTEISLIPLIYPYIESGGSQYKAEIMQLLEICDHVPTFKNRYVKSLLTSNVVRGQQHPPQHL